MAIDEDMAIRFYKVGDASDLADQLVAILKSPQLQRQMSQHNHLAGTRMTMANVVANYLRWFELHRCKRAIRSIGVLPPRLRRWHSLRSPQRNHLLVPNSHAGDNPNIAGRRTIQPADSPGQMNSTAEIANAESARGEDLPNRDGYRSGPMLKDNF